MLITSPLFHHHFLPPATPPNPTSSQPPLGPLSFFSAVTKDGQKRSNFKMQLKTELNGSSCSIFMTHINLASMTLHKLRSCFMKTNTTCPLLMESRGPGSQLGGPWHPKCKLTDALPRAGSAHITVGAVAGAGRHFTDQ